MKWFDRWFYRKCRWAWDHRDQDDVPQDILVSKYPQPSGRLTISEEPDWGDGIRINVKKMIGGYVVSFRTYDRRSDRSDERHYIITDSQEFDRELGKMITLESMRQT
jgi:hypothetical protein